MKALARAISQKPAGVLTNWRRVETLVADAAHMHRVLGQFDVKRFAKDLDMIESIFSVKAGGACAS